VEVLHHRSPITDPASRKDANAVEHELKSYSHVSANLLGEGNGSRQKQKDAADSDYQ
jgi:predicted short-subunit dehydrogenase-like oxidoreductase (DUF2520 family)